MEKNTFWSKIWDCFRMRKKRSSQQKKLTIFIFCWAFRSLMIKRNLFLDFFDGLLEKKSAGGIFFDLMIFL
jgi:hypothetical protein